MKLKDGWGLVMAALLSPALADDTAWAGRWQGHADIPGAPLPLIIDLAPDRSAGWVGSVILPGRGVKGTALRELTLRDGELRFSLAAVLGSMPAAGASLRRQPDGSLTGELRQGGHQTALRLVRVGAAQVDPVITSTMIARELEGTWKGGYELGGYARQVTLILANRPGGTASAELVIVGRRTSRVPVDLVIQSERRISIESSETGITLEGRWDPASARITGHFAQGPFEAEFKLQRAQPGSGS